ncbi:MAG: type II toxin-antitoxin system VapC family toxin [Chloroflexota bacterium]
MDDTLIVETSILIALERESVRGVRGPGAQFLSMHPRHRMVITPIVAGELAAGWPPSGRGRLQRILDAFRLLEMTPEVAWRYGQAARYLREQGQLIGSNDLWIAAAGLAYELPVATMNARHFRRVPGLEVIAVA